MKTLSVTLICKNEEKNLLRLLPTLTFADEIVIVDTGSTDNTVEVAKRFTEKVYHFKWCDDFSKARNYAIRHATCDYVMWLDADDVVPNDAVRAIKAFKLSPDSADVYFVKYRMQTEFPFWFYRERIVKRTGKCRFHGFIHEAITPFGDVRYLDSEILHRPSGSHEQRNLHIYNSAIASGKRFTLRDKFYYAKTLIECGLTEEALPVLRKFVSNSRAYSVNRVEGYKLLANYALSNGQTVQALTYLSKSVVILPPNAEICCLFASCYMATNDYANAVQWYLYALASKSQSGFVNEYYSKFLPNVQLSVCLWRLGDKATACRFHKAAKALYPDNPTVVANDKWFT